MKLNIACPLTGAQKMIDIDDEKKLRALYDKRISQVEHLLDAIERKKVGAVVALKLQRDGQVRTER